MPSRVMFANGNSISYLYDAAGRKLRTVHVLEGDSVTTVSYTHLVTNGHKYRYNVPSMNTRNYPYGCEGRTEDFLERLSLIHISIKLADSYWLI